MAPRFNVLMLRNIFDAGQDGGTLLSVLHLIVFSTATHLEMYDEAREGRVGFVSAVEYLMQETGRERSSVSGSWGLNIFTPF